MFVSSQTLKSVTVCPDEAAFLHTGALQLFRTICAARPNHAVFAADFDSLPDVRIYGTNAPIVAATVRMLYAQYALDHELAPSNRALCHRWTVWREILLRICCHAAQPMYSFRKTSRPCQLCIATLLLEGQSQIGSSRSPQSSYGTMLRRKPLGRQTGSTLY